MKDRAVEVGCNDENERVSTQNGHKTVQVVQFEEMTKWLTSQRIQEKSSGGCDGLTEVEAEQKARMKAAQSKTTAVLAGDSPPFFTVVYEHDVQDVLVF